MKPIAKPGLLCWSCANWTFNQLHPVHSKWSPWSSPEDDIHAGLVESISGQVQSFSISFRNCTE